jgi:hypothetical protein
MRVQALIVALSASLLCFNALAQTRDIGLQVGVNVPIPQRAGIGSDIMFGIGYGQFYYNGLGFRTGIQYSASVADIDDVFGVPIAFAYRTHSKSAGERFETGFAGARNAMSSKGFLGGFLLNLFSDMEFFAGVTPGYIAGSSGSPFKTSWGRQSWEETYVEKKYAFSLTLDAGMSLNYSIWRFDLKLTPAFHYILTDNYIYHSTIGETGVGVQTDSTTPLRWFFTLNGGIAFRF